MEAIRLNDGHPRDSKAKSHWSWTFASNSFNSLTPKEVEHLRNLNE